MNSNQKKIHLYYYSYVLLFCFLIFLQFHFIFSQINDIYEVSNINGEEGSYLVDFKDYHNLRLVISTSKIIYKGIPPVKISETTANLNNFTATATINENYILVSCLSDSLLGKINIFTGEYTSLLLYSDISTPESLTAPQKVCSLSIFENLVFIGYSNPIESNINNIVIKIQIKNKDDENGPILDLSSENKYFIFNSPYKSTSTDAIRHLGCEAIYITNDVNNYRLICAYETYIPNQYYIYALIINENFDGIDGNADGYRLSKLSSSGIRVYRFNNFNVRCVMRKNYNDLSLEYINNEINMNLIRDQTNLTAYSATRDLFDYNNNFIVSSEIYKKNFMGNNNFYYFTINKATSNNYYKIYEYTETSVSRILCYFDDSQDLLIVVYQGKTNIKYFFLKNSKNFFEIGKYSQTIKLKSYEEITYNIGNLFQFSNYGNLQVQTKKTYNSTHFPYELNYGGDNFKNFMIESQQLVIEPSIHNWYEFIFAFIESNNNFARLCVLPSVTLYIQTCPFPCNSCINDFYKCENCKNESYSMKKDDNYFCYPVHMRIEGYLYNLNTKKFERCYSSCQFCSKIAEESSASEHNCESCKEGYAPSYEYLHNCYKINENEINLSKKVNSITDEGFTLVDNCMNYKIISTGECIDICPFSDIYYEYISNNINLTDLTLDLINKDNYNLTNVIAPKILFNNICYDLCPSLTNYDDINNKCVCEYAFHLENGIITCYDGNYCINSSYKYHLDDTKECILGKGCPSGYYQFNFECYKNGCPPDTTTDSYRCISNLKYCYINKYFQNNCSDIQNNEYLLNFENTAQYLKLCDESLIYTTYESKTYFYNKSCYLECPENTIKNDITNTCDCESYGYYSKEDNNYICYSREERCKDKIPVIDLNVCLNNIDECRQNNYKVFNNECYSIECPINTKLSNNDDYSCVCSFFYYKFIINNTLNCFENSITCENKNYLYSNPETNECYDSLEDCFNKGNIYYFNNECFKEGCPNGKIALSSTNEEIQNYFINELSLEENLKNKICICDIINSEIKWNKTEFNQIECLEECSDDYEPEKLTHKCVEKCNPNKHYNFNNECYKEGCPNGTILNSTENENGKKICVCENLYYFDEQNNLMICLNNIQSSSAEITEFKNIIESIYILETTNIIESTKIIESTNLKESKNIIESTNIIESKNIIKSTNIIETTNNIKSTYIIETTNIIQNNIPLKSINYNIFEFEYPEEYYKNPDNCRAIFENKCYLQCPEGTCLSPNYTNLIFCIPIESNYFVFNDICFINFYEILKNLKNISDYNQTISISQNISISVYTTKTANHYLSMNQNLSIIYLNKCEDLLFDYYNLTNDTILYVIGIDSPNKNKSYVINVYNYGVFLENGFQLDHINICKDNNIIISSPIINTDSIKIEEAYYFYSLGYDIYNKNDIFYNEYCSSASLNGNDITLKDRKQDFYPGNYILCNRSCEYQSINFTSVRFICECNLSYNFSGNTNNNDIDEVEDDMSYLDYLLSNFNYKIIPCYELLTHLKNYNNNIGFYISAGTILICLIEIFIFYIFGIRKIKIEILNGIPNRYKLKKKLIKRKEKRNKTINIHKIKRKYKNVKNNISFNFIYINQKNKSGPPNKKVIKIKLNNKEKIKIKESNKNYKEKQEKLNNNQKRELKIKNIKEKRKFNKKKFMTTNFKLFNKNKKKNKEEINIFNLKNKNYSTSKDFFKEYSKNEDKYKLIDRKIFLELSIFGNDDSVDKKEINYVPYTQALRIDKRDCLEIFVSIISKEVKLVSLFYYKNPYIHLSLSTSIYLFESLLDLTINCLLYTEDYISEKYNNGHLKLLTSIILSLFSNIFANIITYYIEMLLNFSELLEIIIKNTAKKGYYLIYINKFKKYLFMKLISFYIIENLLYLGMCYYLSIFCIIYNNTQISFLTNYIIGMIQSLLFSLFLSMIIAFLRKISLIKKIKMLYNTSKYLFEKL